MRHLYTIPTLLEEVRSIHPRCNLYGKGQQEPMKHYQVWLRGSDLCDVRANTKNEARQYIRRFYGFKRLPRGTAVIEIPSDYYSGMVENNREIGISAWNN